MHRAWYRWLHGISRASAPSSNVSWQTGHRGSAWRCRRLIVTTGIASIADGEAGGGPCLLLPSWFCSCSRRTSRPAR
ncbi:hypothetical protein E2562_006290 [Oryza meyeriana var. granulata]|uniref:Uncharacterized protein n=1 Tax=Oryza meyeriana var. granulata TaxID=110450 RepID=A0A6G1EFL8_9ORYZ|nr:hypothetical protein E2562_006290 [Oryza meyeriana var. granulata]